LNIFLHLIYDLLKLLVLLVLRIFFRKITFINKKNLQYSNPCLLVSNHPNTLLDPLIPSAYARRKVFFLANASLFAGKFANWFFSTFYCIPVFRPQDKGYKPGKNENSFEMAENHLLNGGTLYVAPEGTSYIERRLRPLKTGTARIALQTAAREDFNTKLEILPVGLNYEDQTRFWKNILIHVGEGITLNGYKTLYEKDPFEAVKKLTSDLEESMESLLISIPSVWESRLFGAWEKLHSNLKGLSPPAQFFASKRKLGFLSKNPVQKEVFYKDLEKYHSLVWSQRLSDDAFQYKGRFWRILFLQLFFLPLALTGILLHLPFFMFQQWLDVKLKGLYIGYRSAWLVLGGLVFLPLLYSLENLILNYFTGWENSWVVFTIAGLINLVFCKAWWDRSKLILQIARIKWSRGRFKNIVEQIEKLRWSFLE
jgi:glycerol-3-phosphate O-acyltransferase/dihydroxyacetone phosphate acyltransferase